MIKSPVSIPKQFVKRININGLRGRMLHLPKKDFKKIVVLYGQHSALERMYAVAELVNEYGEVYLPDLPGFGGMDSFYKIGEKPSYDLYADYLYSFLKSQKLTKDTWFFVNSLSSQILTRMFQRHPDSIEWAGQIISFVGFATGRNFKVSRWYKTWLFSIIYVGRTRIGGSLIKWTAFNPITIRLMLFIFSRTKAKMQNDKKQVAKRMVWMEGYLWSVNDKRTHAATAVMMFTSDLVKSSEGQIGLTLHNIVTTNDQYFDNAAVAMDFKKIYKKYDAIAFESHVHAPSLIASKEEVRLMMPKKLFDLLSS